MPEPLSADGLTRIWARTELTSNMFVEAGAGTGKTTLLVSRLVALVVDEERPLGNIAAITFTEKAAAELRDRFRSALVDAGCVEAAEQIDDAQITTIHGFARAILANHAIEAGLPPEFAVLDELAEAVQFDERFDAFIDDLYDPDGPHADAVRLLLVLGHNRWAIRALVRAVDADRHRFDRLQLETPPPLPGLTVLLDALTTACAMRHGCLDDGDRLAQHLETMEGWLDQLLRAGAAGDRAEQFRLLFTRPKITYKNGKKGNWAGAVSKDDVTEALALCQGELDNVRATVGHHVVATLLPVIVSFVHDGALARRRAGTLTFADLLVEARRVLTTKPSVRQHVSDRWPHVLVDEFQDTDDLQIDIITMICSVDADPPSLPWWQREMGGGALFVVGDPKQSIYRFRGADMRLYQRAVETLGGGELRPLYRNFRTVPGVLAWVNATVGALFDPDDDGQATFRALEAHRAAAGVGTAVEIVGVEPTDGKIGEVRHLEANQLVRALVGYRAVGLPAVGPDGQRLSACYGDMAILLPTRTALDAITTALEAAEVPYRIESRSLVFSTPEVRTLVAVLRAVDDPGDAIAVVGALRSPAFGCSDAALLRWRDGGGRWIPAPMSSHAAPNGSDRPSDRRDDRPVDPHADPFLDDVAVGASDMDTGMDTGTGTGTDTDTDTDTDMPPLDPAVAAGLDVLHGLHGDRWWASLPDLVHAVIDRCHLREVALAHRRPQDRWRRLQFVVDEAITFEQAGGRELRAFVDWLEEQHTSGRQDAETVVADLDDDAVRILTVHASKGLEYKVVALAGLGASERNDAPVLAWSGDGQPLARLGSGDTALQHRLLPDAKEMAKALARAETQRLLYVATTRARDHLLVSLHRTVKGSSSASALAANLAEPGGTWQPADLDADVVSVKIDTTVGAVGASAGGDDAGGDELGELGELGAFDAATAEFERRFVAARRSPSAPVVAATGLRPDDHGSGSGSGPGSGPELDDRAPWRRGRAGTSIGRAVHAVLQSVDLASGAGVEEIAALQAAAEGVGDSTAEITRLVRHVLGAPAVIEAARARHWREVFVAAPVGAMTIEGFIDLLVERDDGSLAVIDYKTDSVRTDAEIDATLDRYRRQGAAYALAVAETLGRRVDEVVFVFARAGAPAVQRSLPDLPGAIAEVRSLLAAMATPSG